MTPRRDMTFIEIKVFNTRAEIVGYAVLKPAPAAQVP